MQQQRLHRSLGLLCRQHCRRRLYSASATAAQPKQAVDTANTASDDAGPSTSRDTVQTNSSPDGAQNLGHSSNSSKNATAKGKSTKSTPPPGLPGAIPPHPRLGSKVDTYLASLRAEGKEPLLADLQRLRPSRVPRPDAPSYAAAYAALRDRVCLSFSKKQLLHFARELKLDVARNKGRRERKKTEYAEAILEKEWGWENVKDVERRKRELSEVVVQTFLVSASELFLLLGKDGSQLLQISRDYRIHISVKSDPLSILIEGFKADVKRLKDYMASKRKTIIEETIQLPVSSRMSSSLLQQVSRIAEAYIENVESNGKIRIVADDPGRLETAKRIATRAAVNIDHTSNVALLACLPKDAESTLLSSESSKSPYALYPFATERTIPWATLSKGTFRSRRVGAIREGNGVLGQEPLSLFSSRGGMVFDAERLLCSTATRLEDVIASAFPPSTVPRTITASTGHLLVTSDSKEDRRSLLPPLLGEWEYGEFMKWVKNGAYRVFVPNLPSPLHAAPPNQEKIIHRLTYRQVPLRQDKGKALPIKVIHAGVVITEQPNTEPPQQDYILEGGAGTAYVEDDGAFDGVENTEEWPKDSSDDSLEHLSVAEGEQNEVHAATSPSDQGSDSAHQAPEGSADSAFTRVSIATSKDGNPDHEGPDTMEPIQSTETSSEPDAAAGGEESTTKVDIPKDEEPFPAVMDGNGVARTRSNVNAAEDERSELADVEVDESSHEQGKQLDMSGDPVCTVGSELELLVALPDRPMDIKLTVTDNAQHVKIREFPSLEDYFGLLKEFLNNRLDKNPEPPLSLVVENEVFYLDSNSSVRQSVESMSIGPTIAPDVDSPESELSQRTISTVTETIWDLETSQKLVNCQISSVCSSPIEWAAFLGDLDGLTSFGYASVAKSNNGKFSADDTELQQL